MNFLFLVINLLSVQVLATEATPIDKRVILFQHKTITTNSQIEMERLNGYNAAPEPCGKYVLDLPVASISGQIRHYRFIVYLPDMKSPVPVVVQMPTIVGISPLEGHLGNYFCENNKALIVSKVQKDSTFSPGTSLDDLNADLIDGVRAVRTLIDYLVANPSPGKKIKNKGSSLIINTPLDLTRLGILGTSNGTIQAGLVGAVEDRVKRVLLFAPIGDISSVFTESTEEEVANYRNAIMKSLRLETIEQFRSLVRESTILNPIELTDALSTKNVHHILIKDDTSVPYLTQIEYRDRLIHSERFSWELISGFSHKWSIVFRTLLNTSSLANFFD